jgi:hypothetical protein
MCDRSDSPTIWLAKKYLDEYSLHFRTAWQLYLTFYVAFITLNGGALGLTVQYVSGIGSRRIIAATFIFQNVIAAATAINIGVYSRRVAERSRCVAQIAASGEVADSVTLPAALQQSPVPGKLGLWSGLANFVGHILFIALWIIVGIIHFRN